MNAATPHWWLVNIGSGFYGASSIGWLELDFMANGPNKSFINLVEASKIVPFYPFLAKTLTWTNDDQILWCHMASLGHNELIKRPNNSLLVTDQLAERLTHWGGVMHICVSKLSIIGSDNGLSPKRHQAIILTNAGFLSNGPLGTNFSERFSQMNISKV